MDNKKNYGLSLLAKYITIIIGATIYAVGFQLFLFPNNIPSGGLAGIAMIINYYTHLPVGTMIFIFNIPIFAIAWKHFGLDFLIASLVGTFVGNMMMDVLAATGIVMTNDIMLASLMGGAIKGAGLGLVFYVGATTGGFDIVAKLVRMRLPQMNFGTVVLALDLVIIVLYAIVLQRYESAMYAIVSMFVVSKVIDLIVYGFDTSSLCYIISSKSEEIAQEIIAGKLHRGVTLLDGEGAYSHDKKKIVMCVVKRQQIGDMRRLVRAIDERAFFIVSDTKNVFGLGFEKIGELK